MANANCGPVSRVLFLGVLALAATSWAQHRPSVAEHDRPMSSSTPNHMPAGLVEGRSKETFI